MQKTITIRPLNIKAEKITSLFGIMKGFMFSKKINIAKVFCFQKEILADIHMLFVFFPLIIIWLDKNKRITCIAIAKPFRFYGIHKAKYILEIPYERKILKKLKKGMKLRF